MAARNFTGSARIGAAENRPGTTKRSAEPAGIAARMGDIRAVVVSAIKTLRAQNLRARADNAAALRRHAFDPLAGLHGILGKFVTHPARGLSWLCYSGCTGETSLSELNEAGR